MRRQISYTRSLEVVPDSGESAVLWLCGCYAYVVGGTVVIFGYFNALLGTISERSLQEFVCYCHKHIFNF